MNDLKLLLERELIGKLDFSLQDLEDYFAACDNGNTKAEEEFEEFLENRYGWASVNLVRGLMEMRYVLKFTTKKIYNLLINGTKNMQDKFLGAGSSGVIFNLTRGVLKIFYTQKLPIGDRVFYEFCKKEDSNILPKVYKIGKNWVVMEKLKTMTPKCRKYGDALWRRDGTPDTWEEDDEITDWAIEVHNTLQLAYKDPRMKNSSADIRWPGDVRTANIGERSNGDIVVFDPLLTWEYSNNDFNY